TGEKHHSGSDIDACGVIREVQQLHGGQTLFLPIVDYSVHIAPVRPLFQANWWAYSLHVAAANQSAARR
ncbi:MAG: hypothetical protein VX867_04455, partial [Pseudomonadota bacterium]|nr:hypothetical protein [Pseudomonadota bacterium]